MVALSGWEKQVYFSILMLQNDFGSVFVGEDPQYGIVWLVLHDDIFIFNVIIFESGSIVQVDEEDLCNKELNNLSVSLHRKHLLLCLPILDLD